MSAFLLAAVLAGQGDLPAVPREFRAAWVATVDNIDWPSKRTLSANQQRVELRRIFEIAAQMKLNAIIFQVRPSADALYDSPLEPWSEYLTNQQGRSPGWDPLEFAVDEAHKRGIQLHVWLNPYRAKHPAQKGSLHGTHIGKANPEVVKTYGRMLWMDPGSRFVQNRTLDVVRDVVKRYDIDGVHIDDYFYPYPEGGKDFPDDDTYGAYVRSGGTLNRGDWRRKNVDDFVQNLYRTIKGTKRGVQFGISPFGIYRPGVPEGIRAGIDQYAQLYADAKRWLNEGWCDYFTPQLYWPINQKPQAYAVLLDWWLTQNTQGRNLWPGNFTSRTNPAEGNWRPSEVVNQIRITRDRGANGNVHFSMRAFTANWNGVREAVRGIYSQAAIPPPSRWLDDRAPEPPLIHESGPGEFTWEPAGRETPMWWVVWRRYGNRWITDVKPGPTRKMVTAPSIPAGDLQEFAVAAVDRLGNVSAAVRAPR